MPTGLERTVLRLGLLPLADAAPLVIAKLRGAFLRHGLQVELRVERSWSAIRDKVAAGLLDGGQMLAPMPVAATLGLDGLAVPMVTAMTLSLNGNAITVSTALYERMRALTPEATDAEKCAIALAKLLEADRKSGRPPLVFAHVFPFSTHHYELRTWLSSAGINPDEDVRLCVVPPAQMVAELEAGRVDGICVGGPWGEVAEQKGSGVVVATKFEIWNNSPEKVLGVTRDWAEANPNTHRAMIAALIETARWLDEPDNRIEAARLMSRNGWVEAPAKAVQSALKMSTGGIVFHLGAATFPWRSHAVWFAVQMLRWRQCWLAPNLMEVAHDAYWCETYREAAAMVNEPCPLTDFKTEGTRSAQWTLPTTTGSMLKLAPDLMLGGTTFDATQALRWLRSQMLGVPKVDDAILELANSLSP